MAQQINNLISCETELSHTKKRVALLSSLLAAQSENPEITVQGTDKEIDDVALFNQIDEYIKGNKLFLQPEIDREALIKLVHTNKNKFCIWYKTIPIRLSATISTTYVWNIQSL